MRFSLSIFFIFMSLHFFCGCEEIAGDSNDDSRVPEEGQAYLMFWSSEDTGAGSITVTVDSYGSMTFSEYYDLGPPPFDAKGTATFIVDVGRSYIYSASDGIHYWSGKTPVIDSDGYHIDLYH